MKTFLFGAYLLMTDILVSVLTTLASLAVLLAVTGICLGGVRSDRVFVLVCGVTLLGWIHYASPIPLFANYCRGVSDERKA